MKLKHFCLLIMMGLFVLTGCEERKPKTKDEIMKSLPPGRDYSVTEGFPDAPAPAKNSGKNSQ